ncbi:hypothetical protein CONPUDRAFT_66323 [Coniophora puteana RWD-64-598 SS2]|uniref:Uncharacterized protein n=1 Tax=Coniophora puteana (strain RWD-64-598) TaxID=741705 RepID=A0A5M3M9H4_CONPW|nr:uncharacterized protein CONPUDRAFT_66323 [Coniophora puteana RWD-64-598 SS2]EIW75335.1 hypothetical protein CONPUDRAFT_66323 [Coniophora puteana RWD-64-598 SS2]
MHLAAFNVTDEMIPLWRGTFMLDDTLDPPDSKDDWHWAVLVGDTWERHGEYVAFALMYLPGSFDRPPRNPAEKINSGYKAWEFLLYFYGMCPALLLGVLPEPYYGHFCRLVKALRIMMQHDISAAQLLKAHIELLTFVDNFERIYYQQCPDRLHFVCPWLHALTHLVPEACNKGPPICSSQWTMERAIGSLGRKLRQHLNPYANLEQRAINRVQTNALAIIYPELDTSDTLPLPHGTIDLGQGYVLLGAKDHCAVDLPQEEHYVISHALREHSIETLPNFRLQHWARMRLPNNQVARSLWKEDLMKHCPRIARNIKFESNGKTRFAKVQYYFYVEGIPFALVSLYGKPDQDLLKLSRGTVIACQHPHEVKQLAVIDVFLIKSVVAMILHEFPIVNRMLCYLVEKPGLEIATFAGHEEIVEDK